MPHVKPYPHHVSDVMTADVVGCLRRLVGASGEAGRIGGRFWKAMAAGSPEAGTHPFFCAPLPYEGMPEDLREEFAKAALTSRRVISATGAWWATGCGTRPCRSPGARPASPGPSRRSGP
ncbi:hypothetical protein GCM10010275_19250 [Streptomyces litmocidini]|nr:hypothetical protein GCM10010275_19250 [Streptomyces litmocidini]